MGKQLFLKKQYISKNAPKTQSLGVFFARRILKITPRKYAIVLALEGELGAGKTTFLQGFAKGLGIKTKVQSPTFVIIRKYKIKKQNHGPKDFYHIDCYRINNPKEIVGLGFRKMASFPKNIIAIEWADRIPNLLPKEAIRLLFQVEGKKKRKIKLSIKK